MASTLKLRWDIISGALDKRVREMDASLSRTATLAMDEARRDFLVAGRANIAAGGNFGKRWQNALRAKRFPEGRDSMSAAVFIYHKIPYAGVFEDGSTIVGSPLLWLPLPGTPARVSRKRMTPARLAAATGNPLVSMRAKSGTPLLGMEVRLPKTQAAAPTPKISLARLRKGREGRGVLRTVPLFAGVDNVKQKKRFSIERTAAQIRDQLPVYYSRNFKDE